MAYIQPTGVIHLLGGINIDSNYNDTLYFDSEAEQQAFFKSKLIRTLSNQYYTRVSGGVIKAAISEQVALSINYLMFQNANTVADGGYSTKWFYAFVKRVEYVSNGRYNIYYDIDVMQTYFFNYRLPQCFVEREHTDDDTPYLNHIEEDLDTGEPIVAQEFDPELSKYVSKIWNFNYDLDAVLIVYHPNTENNKVVYDGINLHGIYSAFNYMAVPPATLTEKLNELTANNCTIIDCIMMPSEFIIQEQGDEHIIQIVNNSVGTYYPKNKKLLSYPYRYYLIINNEGKSVTIKPELIDGAGEGVVGELKLVEISTIVPSPLMMLYPKNYDGVNENYEHGLYFTQFPQVGVSQDTYRTWWAQNKNSYTMGIVADVIGTVNSVAQGVGSVAEGTAKVLAGDLSGAGDIAAGGSSIKSSSVSGGLSIAKSMAKKRDMKNAPDSLINASEGATLLPRIGRFGFTVFEMTLHRDYLESIDNYFSLFGYSVKRVKVPNRNVRTCFTFTKTNGCKILPIQRNEGDPAFVTPDATDCKLIESIYDNGVRFWISEKHNNIGNYLIDNPVKPQTEG